MTGTQLTPLTPHLFLVNGENQGNFPRSHSFYVRDDICALIDTGIGIDRLRRFVAENHVDIVINSHGHPDHTAGNWVVPNGPLWAPIQGQASHGRLELLSDRFAQPGDLAAQWRRAIRSMMGFEDRLPTDWFDDGRVFDFGHQRLQAVHAPGHTADHYLFWDEQNGVLLSFDIDLTRFGPWYGHRESDLHQFRASIQLGRDLAPRTVASSHLPPISGDAIGPAFDAFAAVLDRREKRILGLLDGGATLADLVAAKPVYGSHPYEPEVLAYWEGEMIALHLNELVQQGRARRDGDVFTAP